MRDFLIDNIAEEAKVSEDNAVFVYRVLVLNENGKAVHEDWAFSDYFFADKAESITFDGFITLSKSFTVKVYALVGGKLKSYNEMMNEARAFATKRMVAEAEALGADAIVNIRYASSAIMQGAAEVIAYGTAVKIIK